MVSFGALDDRTDRSPSANAATNNGTASVTPVAIIGMACRLPGGIDSPELLWETLLRGADMVTEVPPERWDADEYYDPEPGVPGRSVTKWGAFIDDVGGFDADFFGISEAEATAIDPQHRLLLETSWEAVEHAGLNPGGLAGSNTGVYVALGHNDYQLLAADAHALEGPYGFLGNGYCMASGRISYALGLHGPALTVDTACSAGLVVVHMACRSLHDGECDLALAGGSAVALDPRKFSAGSAGGMLSPTGHCNAFDVGADGFVAGEGCAVVLLQRLPDALRDGDRILAVVRGTALNNDGRTVTITTPSREAQVAAYQAALATAGVDAATVGMVETHGTGTPTGDPIEYASLAEVYGIDGPCALAAAKTNFGHSQSTAGTLGLIKAVLSLQHGVVPRNLHFSHLPDELNQIKTNLFVPQENTPWPTNGHTPRRAAVSAYGFSGTNAHAILEQAPETAETSAQHNGEAEATATPQLIGDDPLHPASSRLRSPLLFPLSSTSADELRRTAGRLADWVQAHDDVALPDLAYTMARRRAHRPVRTTVIASSRSELSEALREVADGDTPYQPVVGQDDRGPVWVFSGQGSQWAAMGAQLLANEPVFSATVAQAEPVIARESGFSVTEAIKAAEVVTGQDRIQPTLFTMQVALAATMKSYGVRPGAVIGHSLGEAAAAVAAGALSLEDGLRVICRRSQLMSRVAGAGATASVELPAQQVLSELTARGITDVVVAIVASPQSTVIAGAAQNVHDLVAAWQQRDVMAREVPTDVAFHSPQVDPILDELTQALADLNPMSPEVPFYSATLFDPREQPVCGARYWADNMRRMVRFAAAVQAALEDGYRVFAELSPHPLLTHALEQTARGLDMPLAALAAMRREQPLPYGLRGFVADLHNAGAAVDFSVLYPGGRLVDAPLPTWTHRHLMWSRDNQESQIHGGCTVSVHPLLGPHVQLHEEPERHVWQGEVGTAAQPWLADHQIRNVPVLPGAAYCEMALAAAHAVFGEAAEVRDIRFEQALRLDEQTTVGASVTLSSPGVADFTVETSQGGQQVRHAAAVLQGGEDEQPPTRDISALLAGHPGREEGADVRARLDQRGVQFGPAFTALGTVHTGEGETHTVLAEVALPRQIRSQQDAYGVHPALLDTCFQTIEAHPEVRTLAEEVLGLPLGARRIRIYGPVRNASYCYARVTKADTSGVDADFELLDEHGAVLLSLQGARWGTRFSGNAHKDRLLAERLLTIEWRHRELPDAEHVEAGAWLLISTTATADVVATKLTDVLKNHGAQCATMCWPPQADYASNREQLANHLRAGGFNGVVILTGPKNGDADDQSPRLGREYVQHLVRITRELPEISGESPRLYVVTRNAQAVLAGDRPNL